MPIPAKDRRTDRLVRLPEVLMRTGLSRATIYRRESARAFPVRVRLGPNMVAWYESDIGDFVADPMGYRA